MEIFKITYSWFEGEYDETYLGKNVEKEEFEKDIKDARAFAESLIGKKVENEEYLGKGYSVECLPKYYHQIIWFLTNKKGYVECSLDDSEYAVDEEGQQKPIIGRKDKKIITLKIG